MNTILRILTLAMGFQSIGVILPMDYCSRTNSSANECGIWEAQIITAGLTISAFIGCTWLMLKSCNKVDQKKLLYKIKANKKPSYQLKAARGTTTNFKRR